MGHAGFIPSNVEPLHNTKGVSLVPQVGRDQPGGPVQGFQGFKVCLQLAMSKPEAPTVDFSFFFCFRFRPLFWFQVLDSQALLWS